MERSEWAFTSNFCKKSAAMGNHDEAATCLSNDVDKGIHGFHVIREGVANKAQILLT